MPNIPSEASVVIVGGGIAGLSTAYHLAKLGRQDIVLLERKQIACGTTWHAAGLIRSNIGSATLSRIAMESQLLFKELEAKTGQATGFKQNGSLGIADNPARWEEHRRAYSFSAALGVEAHLVDAAEAGRLYPFLETSDLLGALWYPTDGQVNPLDLAQALAKGARQLGVRIIEGVKATGIQAARGRVSGVETDHGAITAPVIVNAAGMWAREFGALANVPVPVQACEHFYVVTEPVADLPTTLPVLRDMDGCAYYKEDAGKLLLGAFEPKAKPWGLEGIPEDFCFDELPEDFDHLAPILEHAARRVPVMGRIGLRKFFNGPEGFTPDQSYYLGPAATLAGFYVIAGFNSIGIQSGGGAGKALAEWIEGGEMPFDLSGVDAQRAETFQAEPDFLVPRVSEALGMLYAMHWPFRQFETSRDAILSPVHQETAAANACFGEVAGIERPNWYANPGQTPAYIHTYGRQNWFENSRAEHLATRNAVGLFDQSSFGKFAVSGQDALPLLERLSANKIDVPVGRVVYTQWLNSRGGIEADLTISRTGSQGFLVITGAAVRTRDLSRLNHFAAAFEDVIIADISRQQAVLGLMGPEARTLLQPIAELDLSHAAFRFARTNEAVIAGINTRMTRITYMGELGWEIACDTADTPALWRTLAAAGAQPAGMHAMDSLRIEKGYRHWGHDISPEDDPFEAGLDFVVKLEKPTAFTGQTALQRRQEHPLDRRMTAFKLDDPVPLLYGHEPIFRDGECVGYLTSASYGHSIGAAIGLGYVKHETAASTDAMLTATYQIEIAGERHGATASLEPLFAPENAHMRV
jgi:glycine cleavage system aminomethyltransferase T/glycine/D-amino acid oxidase-like deaminating enzyme